MVKVLQKIVFYTLTFPIAGYVLGGLSQLARLTCLFKVEGMENFPNESGKIMLVSNHPSMTETFILPGLFFRHYVFRPKHGPWVLAGSNLWRSPIYFLPMCVAWGRVITVLRKQKRKERSFGRATPAFDPAVKVLEDGGNIFFFPEGGRTWKREKEGKTILFSAIKGRKLAKLRRGVALLASQPGVILVPVWVEWSTRTITVGEPHTFTDVPQKEIISRIEQIFLELADKVA